MPKKYLLDANIFIEPSHIYYPFDLVPGFWHQMKKAILNDNVLILDVIYDEIVNGDDELASWLKGITEINKVITDTQPITEYYSRVLNYISECKFYKTAAIDTWADRKIAAPWLIAMAIEIAREQEVVIITFEKPIINTAVKGHKNKKVTIPDVAANFNITCENLHYFMREMGIKWE